MQNRLGPGFIRPELGPETVAATAHRQTLRQAGRLSRLDIVRAKIPFPAPSTLLDPNGDTRVASELLFDIKGIDLNAVVVSPEEVGKVLLQQGDMRHLDWISWMNDDFSRAIGVKDVRSDEFWVPGHIPGRPLLPGVLMIEAGAQLCSYLQQMKLGPGGFLAFTHCTDCSFRGVVVPGDRLHMLAIEVERNRRRFISKVQAIVGEKFVFEATITGMRI